MPPKISPSEWKIMELLWQQPHTLMQIIAAVAEENGWTKSTVTSLLRRLEEKGMIAYQTNGRTKSFYALADRQQIVAEQTESFLQRAYNGSVGSLVSAMAACNSLKQEDIDELYAILQKAEEDAQ